MVKIKRLILIILLIGLVISLSVSLYFLFFYEENCSNFSCFQKNMVQCDKAIYINDAPEATWRYEIIGNEGRECKIDVKLLQAKEGELGMEKLENFGMECFYSRGVSSYPEKDLTKCHGRLKEEMQGIIIEKLHSVLVENLIEFDQSIRSLS